MEYKDESKLSIVIVPGAQRIRRLAIANWLPKAILAFLICLPMMLVLFNKGISASTENLQGMYEDKSSIEDNLEERIAILEEIGRDKEDTISDLAATADGVQGRIDDVDLLLKDIAKLQKQVEKQAGITTASRASGIGRKAALDNMEPEEGLENLKKVLDDKEKELEDFIVEIDNRFKYLASLPNRWPASGRLTSRYGNRKHPLGRKVKFHSGIDIANSPGTSIKAAGAGVVTFAGSRSGYGRVVKIKHNSQYETLYAHNSRLLVNVGDRVEKGQQIAKMGTTGRVTGCHLHFELHKNGKTINPLTMLNK